MKTRDANTLDFSFDPPKIRYGIDVKVGGTWYRVMESNNNGHKQLELFYNPMERELRREEIRLMTERQWINSMRTFNLSLT